MRDRLTLLHVDDDPDLLAVTDRMAAGRNVAVRSTTDADAALDRLDGIDCVVGDSIRTADGESFVLAARRAAPDVPIVLFTAKEWEAVETAAAAAGADGYVQKGDAGSFRDLFDRIEAVAGTRRPERELFEVASLRDEPGWTVVDRYDRDADDELGVWLLEAIDRHTGHDVADCPPLFDVVDPEALDALLASTTEAVVDFRYLDYQLCIDALGDLAIRPA